MVVLTKYTGIWVTGQCIREGLGKAIHPTGQWWRSHSQHCLTILPCRFRFYKNHYFKYRSDNLCSLVRNPSMLSPVESLWGRPECYNLRNDYVKGREQC